MFKSLNAVVLSFYPLLLPWCALEQHPQYCCSTTLLVFCVSHSLSFYFLLEQNTFLVFQTLTNTKNQSPIRTDCFCPQLLFSTKSHRTLETNPISTSSKLARSKPSKILFRSFEFVFCFLFLCFLLLVEFLLDSIVVVSTILVLVSTCVFPHLFLPCPVLSRTSSWHSRVEVYYLFCNR